MINPGREGPGGQAGVEHTDQRAIGSSIRRARVNIVENSLTGPRGRVRAVPRGGRNEAPDQEVKRLAAETAERVGYFATANATKQTIRWTYARTEPATSVDGQVKVYVPVSIGDMQQGDELILTSPAGTRVQLVDTAEERALTEGFEHKRQVVVQARPTDKGEEIGGSIASGIVGATAGLPINRTVLPRIGYPFGLEIYDIPVPLEEIREEMKVQRRAIDDNSQSSNPDKIRKKEDAVAVHKKLHDNGQTGLSYYVAEVSAHSPEEAQYFADLYAQQLRTMSNVEVTVTAQGSVEEALYDELNVNPGQALTPKQMSEAFPTKPDKTRGIMTYHYEQWETSLPPEPDPIVWGRLVNEGVVGDAAETPVGAFGEIIAWWATSRSGKTSGEMLLVGERVAKQLELGGEIPGVIIVDLKGNKEGDASIGQQMKKLYKALGIEADVFTVKPGELDQESVGLNPVNSGREPMHTYLPKLAVMLTDCFELIGGKSGEDSADNRESMLRIITSAIEGNDFRAMEGLMRANGWDPQMGLPLNDRSNPLLPVFIDLVLEARMSAESYGYAGELNKNLPVWAEQRMLSLASTAHPSGRFFSGASMDRLDVLDDGALLHYDLSNMDRVSQSMAMKLIFLRAYGYAMNTPGKKVILVLDEINKLATKGSPMEKEVVDLVQRAAAMGVEIIIGGQDPFNVPLELVNNANTTFVGRLAGDENQAVARSVTHATDAQLDEVSERRHFAYIRRGMKFPAQGQVTDISEILEGAENVEMSSLRGVVDRHLRDKPIYTEAEIIDYTNELDRKLTGAVLTVFADVAAATTLGGLEKHVGIDWANLAPNGKSELGAAKYFRKIMGFDERKKRWMIKEATLRAVVHRAETQELGDKGISVEEVWYKVERDLQAAFGMIPEQDLDFTPGDMDYDEAKTFVPDSHTATAEIAQLTGHVLRETDAIHEEIEVQTRALVQEAHAKIRDPDELKREVDAIYMQGDAATQQARENVERHPDSDRFNQTLGYPVRGETAKEQLDYLRARGQLVDPSRGLRSLLFARSRQNGRRYIDRGTGMPIDQVGPDTIVLYLDKLVTVEKPPPLSGPQEPTERTGILDCLTLGPDTKRLYRNEAVELIDANLRGAQM